MIDLKMMEVRTSLKMGKDFFNPAGGFPYRNAESMLTIIKPVCEKKGLTFFFIDEILNVGKFNYLKTTLVVRDTEDGEELRTDAFAREDEFGNVMASPMLTGAASSYAHKYALQNMFAIDDGRLDPDSFQLDQQGNVIPGEPMPQAFKAPEYSQEIPEEQAAMSPAVQSTYPDPQPQQYYEPAAPAPTHVQPIQQVMAPQAPEPVMEPIPEPEPVSENMSPEGYMQDPGYTPQFAEESWGAYIPPQPCAEPEPAMAMPPEPMNQNEAPLPMMETPNPAEPQRAFPFARPMEQPEIQEQVQKITPVVFRVSFDPASSSSKVQTDRGIFYYNPFTGNWETDRPVNEPIDYDGLYAAASAKVHKELKAYNGQRIE